MQIRLTAIISAILSPLCALGLDIHVGAGESLAVLLAGADASERILTVSGTVCPADLNAVRDILPDLTVIDLTEATIVPPEIPEYAFAGTPLAEFKAPASLRAIGEAAFAATALTTFHAPENLVTIGRYAFAHCSVLESATLGDNLTTIGDHAFADCPLLSGVVFANTLVTVGDCAMQGCSLTEIDLSRCTALDKIGAWAFSANTPLVSVSLPGHSIAIGDGALAFCPALTTVSGMEGVSSLPTLFAATDTALNPDLASMESLTAINDHALYAVEAPVQLILPGSLTSLGRHSMEAMTSLTSIDATALTAVPEVDDDVWAGIDQSKITLLVADGMENQFLMAPQWREFHIKTPTSGTEGITDDNMDSTITISTNHTMITATSADGSAVAMLTVYMPDGRIAYVARGNEPVLTATLPQLAGQPVIIKAAGADGRGQAILSTILTN